MKRSIATILLAVLGLGGAWTIAASQTAPQPPQAYRPGLGDLMVATVQPRHIKIALAGRTTNWPLAKYELHQLQEALDRVVQAWPRWKGLPLGGMVEAIEKGPMAAVAEAIEAKDANQFGKAFLELSEGCNACHQAANVGVVVIRPSGPVDAIAFPDQDFRPLKP